MEAALALAHPDTAQAPAVVAASGLTRRYGAGDTAVDALRGVSLSIPRGELTAVMGPSGSGKSTLMHILAGLDRPSAGSVRIDGTDLTTLKDNELTKLRREAHRLRLPVLQPAPDALRRGERDAAALDRRREAELGVARGAAGRDRPLRPAPSQARRALRRPAAARRRRSRARLTPDRPLRRRADGQPRLRRPRPRFSASCAAPSTRTARRP